MAELSRPLRFIEVERTGLQPRAVGYGTATATAVWTAVAEVQGRLIEVHPDLEAGSLIQEGVQVLQIDPTDYELWSAQLEAEIAVAEAQLAELAAEGENVQISLQIEEESLRIAQLDLDRCAIRAPFACRIAAASLEKGQFVATGERLFEAFGIAVTEVEAQVPLDQFRQVIQGTGAALQFSEATMETLRNALAMRVVVRMQAGSFRAEWEGRVARVREQLELATRTVRVVVAVDDPFENVVPGERPSLAPGMFCEVGLRGPVRTGEVVIPRGALHGEEVYVVNASDRLERRVVEVGFAQGSIVSVVAGIEAGDRVVTSDPTPAIEGMLVTPIRDAELWEEVWQEAAGQRSVR